MSRFADPDTVACPNCGAHFYRKVPKSISMHYHIEFSDGGVKSFLKEMLPELGRCQTCRFIIEKVSELVVLNTFDELPSNQLSNWQRVVKRFVGLLIRKKPFDLTKMEWKYDYLPIPTFDEYAELFTVSVDSETKHKRAVEACREFHQQFRLSPENRDEIYRKEGYREPTDLEQRQYDEMSEYLLTHLIDSTLDEYNLLRAELLRMQDNFSLALEIYELVEDSKFSNVIELGRKCCEKKEAWLIRLIS